MGETTVVFKALANPNRQKVYQVICRTGSNGHKGITIEQICHKTGMKQPAVSHYVACLVSAGLIERHKSRWWVYCKPTPDGLIGVTRFVHNPGGFPLER